MLSIWRRHHAGIIGALGSVVLSTALVTLTGGLRTIPFWLTALTWFPIAFVLMAPMAYLVFLGLAPLVRLLRAVLSWQWRIKLEKLVKIRWLLAVPISFLVVADLGEATQIRLPTPWPKLSVLLVLGLVALATAGLVMLSRKFDDPPPAPVFRRLELDEPEDVYWSNEPVVAWRSWRWDYRRLRGVYAPWTDDMHEAVCPECDEVPSWGHGCGIYAVKDLDDVFEFPDEKAVIGQVEMWGNVIEHEHGYRASHARIIGVWVQSPALADKISARYPDVTIRTGSPRVSVG